MSIIPIFSEFLDEIKNLEHQDKMKEILTWVDDSFVLDKKIAWNQPVFTDHGTYIIGFSVAKNHISIAPENKTIMLFSNEILSSGYTHTSQIFRILWKKEINYDLLKAIIEFNIIDKKDCDTFWRKT